MLVLWLVGAAAAWSSVLLGLPSETVAVLVADDDLVRVSVKRLVGCLTVPRSAVDAVVAWTPEVRVLLDGTDILFRALGSWGDGQKLLGRCALVASAAKRV